MGYPLTSYWEHTPLCWVQSTAAKATLASSLKVSAAEVNSGFAALQWPHPGNKTQQLSQDTDLPHHGDCAHSKNSANGLLRGIQNANIHHLSCMGYVMNIVAEEPGPQPHYEQTVVTGPQDLGNFHNGDILLQRKSYPVEISDCSRYMTWKNLILFNLTKTWHACS